MPKSFSLKTIGFIWVLLALGSGVAGAGLWVHSQERWRLYLERAWLAGIAAYGAVQHGEGSAGPVRIAPLTGEEVEAVAAGRFAALPQVPAPLQVNSVSIFLPGAQNLSSAQMTLVLLGAVQWPQLTRADLPEADPAARLGQLTRQIAQSCLDPVILARNAAGSWFRLDRDAPWACTQSPADFRLPAAILLILAATGLLAWVAEIAQRFRSFAEDLGSRPLEAGPGDYAAQGPAELGQLIEAVNLRLRAERIQMQQRAEMLAGISHDLGAPATRLRLRAALIRDDTLRSALEADIGRMTGMIDGVLSWTRSAMGTEELRRFSLSALIASIAADYQDTGRPVELLAPHLPEATGQGSLFSGRRGRVPQLGSNPVLVAGRPEAIERAVTNLLDNALKFGRRARIGVVAAAATAQIVVEDEGGAVDPAAIEALVSPFRRGGNAQSIPGFGLGLSIAATIAEQHGGRLGFYQGETGLGVSLEILRGIPAQEHS